MRDLLCLGSVNARAEDRFMCRSDVVSIQIVPSGAFGFPNLSTIGVLGLSSMALVDDTLFLCDGDRLYYSRPGAALAPLEVPGLRDVHEMTAVGASLCIASTGTNELVMVDVGTLAVRERIHLAARDRSNTPDGVQLDQFHCNQGFEDCDGNLCALVHHVDGRQHITASVGSKIAARLKRQGNGGVIDVRSGRVSLRGLKGPHSIRALGSESYALCDSGRFELHVFDRHWRLTGKCPTSGWGRGMAIDDERIYVGISATRRRYLGLMPESRGVPNMIVAIDRETLKAVESLRVDNVEQINNIYLCDPSVEARLTTIEAALDVRDLVV